MGPAKKEAMDLHTEPGMTPEAAPVTAHAPEPEAASETAKDPVE